MELDSRLAQSIDLPLYPAATMSGGLRRNVPPGAQPKGLPEAITARIESLSVATESCTVSQTTVSCPVIGEEPLDDARDAAWKCVVPATRLEVRLSAPNSVPAYRWNVEPIAGETTHVGLYELRPGASLSGWVKPPEGRELPVDVSVELEPLRSTVTLPSPLELNRVPVRTFEHRTDGFWQGTNLLPGRYRIRAESKIEGWTGYGDTVEVVEGAETTLRQPIELLAPTAFEVTLSPPTDPYGNPWDLRFNSTRIRQKESSRTSVAIEVSIAGLAQVEGLLPGPYYLVVYSHLRGQWLHKTFDLDPKPEPMHLEIPIVEVEGEVLDLDPTFHGTLFLVESKGSDRVVMEHKEGEEPYSFEGHVPRPGLWQPYISSRELQIQWGLPIVEIPPSESGVVTYLELEIPNGRVRGVVRDPDNQPVPDATVTASLVDDPSRGPKTITDAEGRFELQALASGYYTISAHAYRRHSTHKVIFIDGPRDDELVLTFSGSRTLEVLVLDSQSLPVPAATVTLIPISSQRGIFHSNPVHSTRPDGRTTFGSPDFLEEYVILVLPPGGVVAMEKIRLEPGQSEVEIILPTWGGTLELEGLTGDLPFLRYLGHQDRPPADVPVFSFHSWSLLRGYPVAPPRQVIPDMPAGLYELCPQAPAGWLGNTSNEGCVQQRLLPGGVATLRLEAGLEPENETSAGGISDSGNPRGLASER